MRPGIRLACLLLMSIAACGDDGGSSTDAGNNDGGGGQDTAPMPNCTALDLTSAPAVTIMNQQVTPNAQGGTLAAGTYQLTSVKLYAQGLPVSGTAKARVEFVVGSATSGAARVALVIDGMALGMPVENDVTGAGLYTTSGTMLNLVEGCGASNPLSGLTYTAAGTAVTIWTEYMVTDPLALTIPIELVFNAE